LHPHTEVPLRGTGDSILDRLGEKLWSFELRDGNDLEERVASWIARQESSSWIISIVVLGSSFAAMVLFAVSR